MIENQLPNMPERLKRRPQYRGYPVPFTTIVGADGTPNFKVTDGIAWEICLAERRCALCGDPLEFWCWYLGSKEHYRKEVVFDLGMHKDCAEYAAAVCPYIAHGKAYGDVIKPVPGAIIKELAPRSEMSNEGVPMFLFRGRSKSASKVFTEGSVALVMTGALFDLKPVGPKHK